MAPVRHPQEGPDWGKTHLVGLRQLVPSRPAGHEPQGKNIPGQVQEHPAAQHTGEGHWEAWDLSGGNQTSGAALVLRKSSGGGNLPGRGCREQAAVETLGEEDSFGGVPNGWCFFSTLKGALGKEMAVHLAQRACTPRACAD